MKKQRSRNPTRWQKLGSGDKRKQEAAHGRRVLDDRQYERARDELKKKNYRQAIIAFQNGIIVDRKGKGAGRALQLVGENHQKLGEHQEAIAIYLAVLDDYPEWEETGKVLLAIGDSYSSLKRYDDALVYYELVNLNYPAERSLAEERISTRGRNIPAKAASEATEESEE